MTNPTQDTYSAPELRDLGSLTQITEDGSVPKKGSAADAYTALGQGTGVLLPTP